MLDLSPQHYQHGGWSGRRSRMCFVSLGSMLSLAVLRRNIVRRWRCEGKCVGGFGSWTGQSTLRRIRSSGERYSTACKVRCRTQAQGCWCTVSMVRTAPRSRSMPSYVCFTNRRARGPWMRCLPGRTHMTSQLSN